MKRTDSNWFPTYTGVKFYPTDPRPEDINIEDIAHSLSQQCRFAGHSRFFYSVAQHSILVANFAPDELKLAALLHDAAEAYCQDLIRPIKHGLNLTPYQWTEDRLTRVIFERFGITHLPPALNSEIKVLDNRALVTERNQVLTDAAQRFNADAGWPQDVEPFENVKIIIPHRPFLMRDIFMELFEKYGGK